MRYELGFFYLTYPYAPSKEEGQRSGSGHSNVRSCVPVGSVTSGSPWPVIHRTSVD